MTIQEHHNAIERLLSDTLSRLASEMTGIADELRADPICYVTTIFQRLRTIEFASKLQHDWRKIKEEKRHHPGEAESNDIHAKLSLFLNVLLKRSQDDISFQFARRCFWAWAVMPRQQKESGEALDVCFGMNAGEVLVLSAAAQIGYSMSNPSLSLAQWHDRLSDYSGIKSHERIQTLEILLIEKGILSDRTENQSILLTTQLTERGQCLIDLHNRFPLAEH